MEAVEPMRAIQPSDRLPLWRRIDSKWLIIGACTLLVAYLALMPLCFLIWQSFYTPEVAGRAAEFTFDNYVRTYTSPETLGLLANSLKFAVGSSLFAFVVGAALAWVNERTNTPFKSLFFALSIVPLIIPGVLFVVAWGMLGSPKTGILNVMLQDLLGTDAVFFDVYSMWGMIWVEGLQYSPMAFLFMTAAFRAMDPSLEESALMSGASMFQVARRVTFRLARPAIFATLLVLFVRTLESFEVPALLGLPVGIQVLTSSIYQAIHQYPSQIGLASTYAVALLVITTGGIYLQSRITAQSGRYATVTGKGFRPRVMDLGRWRYATAAMFIAYFTLIVVLPFLVLLWASLQRFYSAPSWAAMSDLTLDAYRTVFEYPSLRESVVNSVLLAVGSATLIMFVSSVICWIVVKTRLPGRWLLDNLASLPMVFPGLVLGLAIMVFYLGFDIGIYGSLWILFIAYVTRFLPYGLRYSTTSMLQIHKELEESAQMSGASWWMMFRRVVLPLLKPGLLAGWLYVVIVSVRELSSSILLYSSDTRVISIAIWELWENGQYVELSAFGVMFIVALFLLVMAAQLAGKRFGVKEI
ncbi:ABC transporter permease [Pigmentiphaga sp. NML080357]|uniref:ABC transporter permease n=1 Tax=Pigmentiphaga sp. NML080357 TaxID=2008675 RepID=UPI000B41AA24|nr:iron ABC transporter permease [Pigmentiphaga sp. NML080357]OVZ61262.1 ABC transporter permease [Pigmentiphaga sp. NML080357]